MTFAFFTERVEKTTKTIKAFTAFKLIKSMDFNEVLVQLKESNLIVPKHFGMNITKKKQIKQNQKIKYKQQRKDNNEEIRKEKKNNDRKKIILSLAAKQEIHLSSSKE